MRRRLPQARDRAHRECSRRSPAAAIMVLPTAVNRGSRWGQRWRCPRKISSPPSLSRIAPDPVPPVCRRTQHSPPAADGTVCQGEVGKAPRRARADRCCPGTANQTAPTPEAVEGAGASKRHDVLSSCAVMARLVGHLVRRTGQARAVPESARARRGERWRSSGSTPRS